MFSIKIKIKILSYLYELEHILYSVKKLPRGLPGLRGKESACQCRRRGFHPWVGKMPWRRNWLLTPVFLPGELHGQRSLVGYSPSGCKDLYMTE